MAMRPMRVHGVVGVLPVLELWMELPGIPPLGRSLDKVSLDDSGGLFELPIRVGLMRDKHLEAQDLLLANQLKFSIEIVAASHHSPATCQLPYATCQGPD
jgi:hypothetical protein